MPDAPKTTRKSISKSGTMPRPVLEPEIRMEALPPNLPERSDGVGATTQQDPMAVEGQDSSAQRDHDYISGT